MVKVPPTSSSGALITTLPETFFLEVASMTLLLSGLEKTRWLAVMVMFPPLPASMPAKVMSSTHPTANPVNGRTSGERKPNTIRCLGIPAATNSGAIPSSVLSP